MYLLSLQRFHAQVSPHRAPTAEAGAQFEDFRGGHIVHQASGLQSQQDLAGITCKNKTSMTRLIDNMEKRSLVVRIPNSADKRQKLIYLTKKGQDLREKLVKIIRQTLDEAQENIRAKDIALCKKVLRQVYENVKL